MSTFTIGDRNYHCPLHLSLSTIMGKWKGFIVWALLDEESVRYGRMKKRISEVVPISDKMLIQALREMEQDGLILRKVYNVVPPKVEYSLSEEGLRLRPVITALADFGKTYKNT